MNDIETPPPSATPLQHRLMVLGLIGAVFASFWLFAAILTPFVLATCVAYFMDPAASRMARAGIPRSLAAALLCLLLILIGLLGLLLLYPLILAQIGVLLARLPSYVATIGSNMRDLLINLEAAAGPDVVDARLRELVVSQAGQMVSFLGTAATRLIGGGVALGFLGVLLAVPMAAALGVLTRFWLRRYLESPLYSDPPPG